jgi:dimethylamine/trimethylamine dehydrogenase
MPPRSHPWSRFAQSEADRPGINRLLCVSRKVILDSGRTPAVTCRVYAGHRYARELEEPASDEVAFKRHFHTADADDLLRPRD